MGEIEQVAGAATPETICTRVVARVIEELSCIDIAPDSPTWSDLAAQGTKVGQLAVYRGRSGVRRMIAFDVRSEQGTLDVHYVVVLTEPQSLVPHLRVSAWSQGGAEARIHADLLPRAPLGRCPDYEACCYESLRPILERTLRDSRLREHSLAARHREWGSPLALSCTATKANLAPAAACVDAYTDHWARLMRQGTPFAAQRDAEAALAGARHDDAQRAALFTRDADEGLWEPLEQAIGNDAVDMLLAALRDDH